MRSTRRLTQLLLLSIGVVAAVPRRLHAQDECPRCEITRVRVALIQPAPDSQRMGFASEPMLLSNGSFLAFSEAGSIVEFDSQGRFTRAVNITQQSGSTRRMPRTWMLGPGDTLFVQTLASIDLYAPGLTFSRSIFNVEQLAPALQLSLGNGDLVFHGARDTARASYIHVRPSAGGAIRSIPSLMLHSYCHRCEGRMMLPASAPNEFYALNGSTYVIDRWASSGELKQSISVKAPWFIPALPRGPATTAPPAILTGIAPSGAGHLWVTGEIPTAEWQREEWRAVTVQGSRIVAILPPGSPAGRRIGASTVADIRPADREKMYTSIVDAVDPTTGRILASTRFEGEVLYLMRSGHVYAKRVNGDGAIGYEVWRLELVRR